MSEWPLILRIVSTDFSYFFRTKWLLVVLLSLNITDMLVVALVYNRMMSFSYFQFFVPAVVVMGLLAASLDTGRRIWLALREGMVQYYLSLPISTEGLVIAYLLAGGLAGLLYAAPLLAVAIAVLGSVAVGNALILLPLLLIMSTGFAGLAAALAAIASTHGEFFYAYQQTIQTVLLLFSTIFYPIVLLQQYLPSPLVTVAALNPLSLAADGLRRFAFQAQPIEPAFLMEWILTCVPFVLLGVYFYTRVLDEMRVKGKV